jgi:hypothetical protein
MYFRPEEETKQEFFVHVMAHTVNETLGDDWKRKQDALPRNERHPSPSGRTRGTRCGASSESAPPT